MQTRNVFVTRDRDTGNEFVDVWPDDVGIRKFHEDYNYVVYGAAWHKTLATRRFCPRRNSRIAPILSEEECRATFGFFPRPGEAWHINGKGKRKKEDIGFSDEC